MITNTNTNLLPYDLRLRLYEKAKLQAFNQLLLSQLKVQSIVRKLCKYKKIVIYYYLQFN